MGGAVASRRPERDADPGEADQKTEGAEPCPAVVRSEKAPEQEDEDRLGAHHQRHVGAGRQRRRFAEQDEGNDLPDQRQRDEVEPQSRSRSGPDLARNGAREQHRSRRHPDARERKADGIEGPRGDLDEKKGRAPENGQKG
jgi:hypothetical protein